MTAHVLSSVFAQLEVRSVRLKRLEAGGAWSLRFPGRPSLKFCSLVRGECWLMVPQHAPAWLHQGDTFMLSHSQPYVLASDRDLAPADGLAAFDGGAALHCRHGGDDLVMIGAQFDIAPGTAHSMLALLPPLIHLDGAGAAASVVRATLDLLDAELTSDRIGKSLMLHRLADIALVQVLRAYVEDAQAGPGWLRALADRRIGAALSGIHRRPGHPWTVEELAATAGMSRSAFALRFRELLETPPLEYLQRWRLECASLALRRSADSLARIAENAGYALVSAFGHAFKRTFGCGPGAFRQLAGEGDGELVRATVDER